MRRIIRPRHLVDDTLDDDDLDVYVAGYVGQELGDEVVDRRGGEADGVAFRAGAEPGLLAGDIEIADGVVDGEAAKIGVVDHAAAVVALRPGNLRDAMEDAAPHAGVGHAVVVRVLVDERGNEKGAEEFAGQVLGKADADVAAPAGNAGAVGGMRVGGDGDAGFTGDGEQVEGVEQVVPGEQCLFPGRERLDLRAVEESRVPVTHRHERNADLGFNGGRAGGGIDPGETGNRQGAHGGGRDHGGPGVLDQAGFCELLGELMNLSSGILWRVSLGRLRRGFGGCGGLRGSGECSRGIGRLRTGGIGRDQSNRQSKPQTGRQE